MDEIIKKRKTADCGRAELIDDIVMNSGVNLSTGTGGGGGGGGGAKGKWRVPSDECVQVSVRQQVSVTCSLLLSFAYRLVVVFS